MKIRDNKGSIAIFVLVGLLFMSGYLLISYANNLNKSKIAKEQLDIISDIYSYKDGNANAYNRAYAALREGKKQTLTASVENSSTLELTKTFEDKLSNYRIYGSGNGALLPTEYQQVEYLEGTGTQYIDTGVGSSSSGEKLDIIVDFQLMECTNNTWICGTRNPECGYYGGFYTGAGFTYSQTTDYLSRTTASGSGKTSNLSVMLFARNYNGTVAEYRPAKVKIYSATISLNNEMVRNFIPCYRISDNVAGMYDTINGVFYNSIGTEDFIAGEDVEIEETGRGIGDLISDLNNGNNGKYKISLKVTDAEGESATTDIILNSPLYEGDYIDYNLGKVVRSYGGKESIALPEISIFEEYTKIEVLTEVTPPKIEVEYKGYIIE